MPELVNIEMLTLKFRGGYPLKKLQSRKLKQTFQLKQYNRFDFVIILSLVGVCIDVGCLLEWLSSVWGRWRKNEWTMQEGKQGCHDTEIREENDAFPLEGYGYSIPRVNIGQRLLYVRRRDDNINDA